MANTAREIMTGGVDCVGENETVADAARKMAQLGVGALPICGADDRLDELVRTMSQYQVKRLPVIDGHRLVGVVSESDVAQAAPDNLVVNLVKGVYAEN